MSDASVVERNAEIRIVDTTGNMFPLAFVTVGMNLILLSLANAGCYPLDSMILAMCLFCGGFGQFVAGTWAWRKGISFAATALTMYGLFFLTLFGLIVFPGFGIGKAPTPTAMGAFMLVWGVFTVFMFIGTLKLYRALQVVFGLLTVLYFLLGAGNLTGNTSLLALAAWEGLATGIAALYFGVANVLNDVYGRQVMPI
jgi:uncharacterized protein